MATAAENAVRNLTRSEKAAVLIMCMDEQSTAQLFQQMDDAEILKVGNALLKMSSIPTAQLQEIMQEFTKEMGKREVPQASAELPIDGNLAVEKVMTKALEPGRGQQILNHIKEPIPFNAEEEGNFQKMIQQFGPEELTEYLAGEHPQVVSTVLAYAKKKIVKEFVEKQPEDQQIDLIARMAKLQKISPSALRDLRTYITEKVQAAKASGGGEKKKKSEDAGLTIEGLGVTINVLKAFKRTESDKLIESIQKVDAELAEQISKQMFTIEDLERANDPGIRELLRGVSNDDLKVALKNAPDALKEKVFANMSQRAAMILREDMEVMGPLKVEEIEAAQSNVIKVAKGLIKEEKMALTEPEEE